jgi:hypothetical protein
VGITLLFITFNHFSAFRKSLLPLFSESARIHRDGTKNIKAESYRLCKSMKKDENDKKAESYRLLKKHEKG